MPWKKMDVREQRVKFEVAAERREQTLAALCRSLESRPVGYARLKRDREAGVAGIPTSWRPEQSPRRTATAVENAWWSCATYPDWGARRLRVLSQREGIELARNTVHRILLRRGLVREQDQHAPGTSGSSAACRMNSGRPPSENCRTRKWVRCPRSTTTAAM